jgi:ribonucleoside-diphosphate reductase alpha chain
VKRTVRARDLFRALAQGAWASAEPGVLFWDTSARMSNSDLFGEQFKITGVNACQPASATVLTPYGIRTFGDLQVGDNIWGKNGWTRVVRKWSTGIKPVYRFYTSKGVFEGTADHKVFQDGSRVEVQDADSVDGLVRGDGAYHDRCAYPHLYVGQKDQDYLNSEVSNLFVSSAPAGVDTNASAYYVSTTLVAEDLPKTYERTVPDRYFYGGRAKMSGFLRGLFSANGYVTRVKGKGSRVGLKQSSLEMIKQVQIMLSALGIESYITISKEKLTTFGNGDYIQRESYDLNLSSTEALKFMQTIGFVQDYKNESYVPPAMSKYSHPTKRSGVVQFVEELGEMEVFDITVDDRDHAYWTGGLLVSNCSEQVLDQDGVCNLGSLNLARYVADPFTKNARFNYTQLAWDTASSIHFLDNVLEIELNEDRSITEDQRESVIALRRIGLGVMGLADAIAMMGLKYEANPDTAAFLGTVFRNIRNAAYEKSVKLAQQRGACGVWKDLPVAKRKEVVEQGFYATLPLYHKKEIIKHGLRNAVLLSIAPTGSISNLYGVSSGVEPIFARSYTRMMRISGQDETVEVVHPGVQMSRAAGVDDSVWQTAYEVTPRDHVLIQAMIQPLWMPPCRRP